MSSQPGPLHDRPALYLLEAFGLHDEWLLWRIHNGFLVDDGRLTEDALLSDIGDADSERLAMRLGILPAYDPYRYEHINRQGLDRNRRRALA